MTAVRGIRGVMGCNRASVTRFQYLFQVMDLSGYDGQAAPAVILQATPDKEIGGPGYHGGVASEFGFKDHALEEAVGVFQGEEPVSYTHLRAHETKANLV